jgi:histidyl-tRNA synthetase
MSDMILDIGMLPETLFSHIKTEKVKFHEENGSFILTPLVEKEETFDRLIGMFSDGKLSIDNFLDQKRLDMEFED